MATITSIASGLWSAAGTWNAGVPVDNDVVIISLGHVVEFDVDQSAFANGIAGITVTGTLSLSRLAGTYYLKIKAATAIAGAGTFDCGTDVSIIPFAAKHTITGGAGWYIQGSGGLTMTVYAAEPSETTVRLTDGEAVGATVLRVDTDVTGDIWAAGDTIRVNNVNKASNSEERVIDAGGIAAGTITITAGLTAAKIAGSLVHLVTRNLVFISQCTNTAGLLRNISALTIYGGQFVDNNQRVITSSGASIGGGVFYGNNGVLTGSDHVISGGIFTATSYAIMASNSLISGGIFSGNTYAVYTGQGHRITGGLFSGNSSGLVSLTGASISGGTFSGNAYALHGLIGLIVTGGIFENNTSNIFGSSAQLQGISLSGATQDVDRVIFTAYNVLFSSPIENANYGDLAKESYSYSIDHDQVQGAFRAWTKGGVTTKQAVVYPTGYDESYQTVLEDADNEGYWQKEVSVSSGQSVNLDLWLRKDASMTYLPNVQVFRKRDIDPFAGGTPTHTFTMTDSIDTWEHDEYTYSNDGAEDEVLVIRFQGKHASGNLFSALTVQVLNVDLTSVLAHLVDIKGAGWVDESLVSLTADHSILATSAEVAAITSLDAAGVRAALGLALANLDQQFLDIISWAAINLDESITSGEIIQIRGNSWSIPITDLTLSANKQQFAIKSTHRNAALNQSAPAWNSSTPDADALLFIDSDTGLLYLNGALVADPTQGSISYVGTTLTLTLAPAVTALLPPGTYTYGIQSVDALGVVSEIYGGTFTITADIVRAIT